jgi:hypothetical protein
MLLSLSTKPLAKLLMEKYINDIMPKITLTGKYISSSNDQINIDILNENIKIIIHFNHLTMDIVV